MAKTESKDSEAATPKKKGGAMKWVIIIVVLLLVVGGGVGGGRAFSTSVMAAPAMDGDSAAKPTPAKAYLANSRRFITTNIGPMS